jgi:hypothetical protein
MKYDRTKPWQYSIEQLVADLPKWRRDLDMLMIERDRSKHIDMLEQQVLGV